MRHPARTFSVRYALVFIIGAVGSASLSGCGKKVESPASTASDQPAVATLTTAIGGAPGMTTLASAIKRTGLATVFAGTAPYTVLVPQDDAFGALGEAASRLTVPENGAAMAAVIKAHVLPGYLTVADIDAALKAAHGQPVKMTTMAGTAVSFSRNGEALTVTAADGSSARVSGNEVTATNGVAIPIDKVLKKIPAGAAR